MMQITSKIEIKFNTLLAKKAIPEKLHSHYKKWLRYYLDFCRKYHFNQSRKDSLSHFINKLQDKNQTGRQQKQASHAISIYYEIVQPNENEKQASIEKIEVPSAKKQDLKLTLIGNRCSMI